jgi:hypothetical protein
VSYHLSLAEVAASRSRFKVDDIELWIDLGGGTVHVIQPEPQYLEVIRQGDTAIHEAASAFDAALHTVNCALSLGLPSKEVKWAQQKGDGTSKNNCQLRRALYGSSSGLRLGLVLAIDQVYQSIGFELLNAYRNWTTHRGAPGIILSDGWSEEMSIPDEIIHEADEKRRDWLVRIELERILEASARVQCWPFVYPVAKVINEYFPGTVEHFEVPGVIHVENSSNIRIENFTISSGSLSESAAAFKSKNQTSREKAWREYAGEKLAEYQLGDYTNSIREIVHLLGHEAFVGDWDNELCEACKTCV